MTYQASSNQPELAAEPEFAHSLANLSELEASTIDIFVHIAHLFGVSKSVGEIYGLLFLTPSPVTFDYIRTKLTISSGSASQGLRLLRTVGAVRVAYVRGDRRDHFLAETGLRKIVSGFLREKVAPNLTTHEERLQQLTTMLDEIPSTHRTLIQDRIQTLHNWRRQARAVLPDGHQRPRNGN